MQQAVALARKVSATDVTVLLTGETGTGKEVFAQAIHRNSLRKENEMCIRDRRWSYCDLKRASELSDRDLNAAIGWLARENKIDFECSNGDD